MQSFKSKLIIGLIKHKHLFKFKLNREVVDDSFDINEFRDSVDKATAALKLPRDIRVEPTDIKGMVAEWILPENPAENKILFYIHGGGFISGSCITHRMHVSKFARESGYRALLFDYRLAPEHPFPAALDDCITAYEWLLEQGHAPEDIVLGGESAGGTLVLSLLLALKEKNITLPARAFSISPLTDVSCSADSFTYNAKNDIAFLNSWNVWVKHYIGNHDPKDPLLSPQFGNYAGIPPVYLCVGTHEVHLDDCVNVADKMKADGVDLTFRQWPNMVHAFPILAPMFPEATQAMTEICKFVRNSN